MWGLGSKARAAVRLLGYFCVLSIIPFSLPCFIVFLQFYCSHAQGFRRTLLQEFHISYTHNEWNLLFLRRNTFACFGRSLVCLKLHYIIITFSFCGLVLWGWSLRTNSCPSLSPNLALPAVNNNNNNNNNNSIYNNSSLNNFKRNTCEHL